MHFSEFIGHHLGLSYMQDELALLDQLAGKEIAGLTFLSEATASNMWRGEVGCVFLTRYFIPIAHRDETWIGIHLLPAHVASERFAVAELDVECDHLMDHAYSVRAYLYRQFLELDADEELEAEEIAEAKAIFGDDFYTLGEYEAIADSVAETMRGKFGGAPSDYKRLIWFAQLPGKPVEEQLHWLKRASEAFTDVAHFHGQLARLYAQLGDETAAAHSVARSLACYHHTAGYLGYHLALRRDLVDYYAWGRQLLESAPGAFSKTAQRDLMTVGGNARIAWIVSLYKAGELATSLKLLSDFHLNTGTDLHPVTFTFLQRHFEQLGWQWATIWCEVCAERAHGEYNDPITYMGQPLPANWDTPIRKVLGLDSMK